MCIVFGGGSRIACTVLLPAFASPVLWFCRCTLRECNSNNAIYFCSKPVLSFAGGEIRAGALSHEIHHIATAVAIVGTGLELVSTTADIRAERRLAEPRVVVLLVRKRTVNKKATCHR